MSSAVSQPLNVKVRKRDGRVVPFEPTCIASAISAAFRAEHDLVSDTSLDDDTQQKVYRIAAGIVNDIEFDATRDKTQTVDVERIQDFAETQLMESGEFRIARRYILYREARSKARALHGEAQLNGRGQLHVKRANGQAEPLDAHAIKRQLYEACHGLDLCSGGELFDDLLASLYDGISEAELQRAMVMVARSRIEREPAYNRVATRLLLNILYREALGIGRPAEDGPAMPLFEPEGTQSAAWQQFEQTYRDGFVVALQDGIEARLIDSALLSFDLPTIIAALQPQRDEDFQYLGMQTVYDRYLQHIEGRRIETPQFFWMRVAMGLSLNEDNSTARTIEFYEMLSTFRFVSATPTLFNAGTCHPQLSSCYLTSVDDDLHHIFKCIQDNAMLSKWAGGLGNDWTRVRATGAKIKGTNGQSQGVIPFLKVANDAALAVNQGGKRKGAVCAYMEPWHLDFEEFLDLRRNTGDDRRRTHDMHTAAWIPDLFIERVQQEGKWTLLSPEETPDLHELYGDDFRTRYEEYEAMAARGELRQHKQINAIDLWRRMLSMLFETGHPWLTFKDPSNIRSPQDHAGVVHNSNLCTEILLNTSNEETAVCNLGSINLKAHTTPDGIDRNKLAATVQTAVRMLDNVIDINYYPTQEAQTANKRHRPIGLGVMGFQDALFIQRIPYASDAAVEFADELGELISYHAILASSGLAEQRGTYESFQGSKWDRGLLPLDTLNLLCEQRGGDLEINTDARLDWQTVRDAITAHGMRNSNVMAIAPTATISNIAGCFQSIEPTYLNLFVKSNLSGDFTIVNEYLINDLKQRDLWDDRMIEDLKYYDGALGEIERIPDDIKQLYQTAFEIDPYFLIEATSRRQKWIDMGISFNQYLAKPSGAQLSDMYMNCWRKGLKTTYYLRSVAATQIEKSTADVNKHGIQPRWMKSKSASAEVLTAPTAPKACSILDPDCEACQ